MPNQTQFDLIIIGGGLAGCAAACHLRRRGFRVLLLEQKIYPCHKLCGEVLSPEVRRSFEAMGVWDEIAALQPAHLDRVLITARGGQSYRGELPSVAYGLSRYALDWTLWAHCESLGVEAVQGFKAQAIDGDFAAGFRVSGVGKDQSLATFGAKCVIGAFGKRSNIDRVLHRPFWTQHHGYVAFKAHFAGVDLGRWVELHGFDGGYCGLCNIESEQINLCLIVKESIFRSVGSDRKRLFDEVLHTNPALRARLEQMHQIGSKFLSIGQIAFSRKSLWEGDVLMLGDSAELIAPLCGDGMAMAMRSAEIAAPLVDDYLNGKLTALQLKSEYVTDWKREFRGRLRVGKVLQDVFFQPTLAAGAVGVLSQVPALGRFLIARTRGHAEMS